MPSTNVTYWIIGLTIAATLANVLVALRVLWKSQQTYSRSKVARLEIDLSELARECDSLRASFKKLNARYAMQIAREKGREEAEPPRGNTDMLAGETPDQWKARMKREYRFTPGGLVPK